MTVFTWKKQPANPDVPKDEFDTQWATSSPRCVFCGGFFENGQRAWHWHIDGSDRDIRAHATCVADNATGILKDIGECLK